jgi:hypothetical protein
MSELAIQELLDLEAAAVATYSATMNELWAMFSSLLCEAMAERRGN